ncbi:MAG: hypothetical protein WAO55_13640 [Candidatus Manganitrophaceae bacterium]
MRRSVFLSLSLLLLGLAGCGGDPSAPLDATVSGPEDSTITVNPPGGGSFSVGPLEFKVLNKAGAAVPGVEIELFAGNPGLGAFLIDLNGNLLNSNDPTYFKTKTDDRGLISRVFYVVGLPVCGTEDQTMTGSVQASVGVSSKLWTGTYTIKKC